MSEGEHKASLHHTPAEWISSNQDQYINADKARYNSEKVYDDDDDKNTEFHLYVVDKKPGIFTDLRLSRQDQQRSGEC